MWGPGEGKIQAHRPEPLTVPIGEDDELDMGPVMVESPIAARPPRRAPHQPPPAQQSVAMRDSMSLFLQVIFHPTADTYLFSGFLRHCAKDASYLTFLMVIDQALRSTWSDELLTFNASHQASKETRTGFGHILATLA